MPRSNKRGYLYHQEGSRKGVIHEAYDRAGGGNAGLAEALRLRGVLERSGEILKEGTIKSWISDWNSPNGYHAQQLTKLAAGRTAFHETRHVGRATDQMADDARPFRQMNPDAGIRKRPVNVTIDVSILAAAKAMDMNLSQVLEDELRKRLKDERGRRWAEENKGFIESYNVYVERNGVFGEDLLDLDGPI